MPVSKDSYSIAKRLFDLLTSITLLLLLMPVMLLLAILIICVMGSPVLFRQTRPGLNGEPFLFYKFRTMSEAKDSEGNSLPDESRLGELGLFLRRTSLDELPQLFNVIVGDMSLVGPRPLLMEYLPLYSKEQMRRHDVLPGITGWAQVNGRNRLTWQEKFSLDTWYIDNCSFWLDIKILSLSIYKVLKREDISGMGVVTAKPFEGNEE